MARATKQQSNTAGKGVKSKSKRKAAKKTRTRSKTRRSPARPRMTKKRPPATRNRKPARFEGELVIEVVRTLATGRGGTSQIKMTAWEQMNNTTGQVFVPREPLIGISQVVDEEWSNLNRISPTSVLYMALVSAGIIADMKLEFDEDYESIRGDYEDYYEDADEDAEDDEDDDYDD